MYQGVSAEIYSMLNKMSFWDPWISLVELSRRILVAMATERKTFKKNVVKNYLSNLKLALNGPLSELMILYKALL